MRITSLSLILFFGAALQSCTVRSNLNKTFSYENPSLVTSNLYPIALDQNISAAVLPDEQTNTLTIDLQSSEATSVEIRGGIVGVLSDESAESVDCDRLEPLESDVKIGPKGITKKYSIKETDFILVDTEIKDGLLQVSDRHFKLFPGRQPRAEVCIIKDSKVVGFFAKVFPFLGSEKAASFSLNDPLDSTTNTAQYAEYCYSKIKARLLDGPYRCKDADRIPFRLNGVDYEGATPPATCDTPAWLERDCVSPAFAYMQQIETTSNDVDAVLLCRHKGEFTDDNDKFNDIAIIMHNRSTGGTGWFQGLGQFNGDQVVAPHKDTGNQKFWMQPIAAKEINCSGCHDSGPWMNSPHALLSGAVPEDSHGPYYHIGAAFKDHFNKPEFIDVGDYGLGPNNEGNCTTCHKIGKYSTCLNWIDQMVGKTFSPGTSEYSKQFENRVHMPPGHSFSNQAEFDAAYGEHLKAIYNCCQASYQNNSNLPSYCSVGSMYENGELVPGNPYPNENP